MVIFRCWNLEDNYDYGRRLMFVVVVVDNNEDLCYI